MNAPTMEPLRTNTILYCEDYADAVAFYRDLLGLEILTSKEWFTEFRLTGDGCLSVADARRTSIPAGGGRGITLSWQVEDVRAVRYRLAELGVETSPVVWRWGAWTLFLHDPEGNRIELWS